MEGRKLKRIQMRIWNVTMKIKIIGKGLSSEINEEVGTSLPLKMKKK